jgi:hypothetical protein
MVDDARRAGWTSTARTVIIPLQCHVRQPRQAATSRRLPKNELHSLLPPAGMFYCPVDLTPDIACPLQLLLAVVMEAGIQN